MKGKPKGSSAGPRSRRKHDGGAGTRSRDLVLKGGVVAVAVAAAMFPWYVFFNQEKFGVNVAGWEGLRDLKGFRQREAVQVPPISVERQGLPSQDPADMIFTATTPKTASQDIDGETGTLQPFPGQSRFRLLHVSNGRAMIEDSNGIYVVQTGSILPDNSRLASLTQKDGKWVIVTTSGEVYETAE